MLEQAQAELPNECCGLLAGRIVDGVGRVEQRYPLLNELPQPPEFRTRPRGLIGSTCRRRSWRRRTSEYNADVKGLIAADKDMRAKGIELLAIYHSHPRSKPAPSRTDLARNFYGTTVMYLILGVGEDRPMRGWWLAENCFEEAAWDIEK